MFNGINLSTVTDYKLGSQQVNSVYYGSQLIWPASQHDYSLDYLTIISLEDNNTIGWCCITNTTTPLTIDISEDNGATWTSKTAWPGIAGDVGRALATLNTGEKLLIKGNNQAYSLWKNGAISDSHSFTSQKQCNVQGNIMSLIYGDNFIGQTTITADCTFCFLFSDSASIKIIDASNLILPATTLTNYCYADMFLWTDTLTAAPTLPATSLADYCYTSMFRSTNITTAPALPATTLAEGCYDDMFRACRLLTTAPELPATTLVDWCYAYMFTGCISLNYIKCLATTIYAYSCTKDWTKNVASSGTFYKDANTTWSTGDSGIPSGWTIVNV